MKQKKIINNKKFTYQFYLRINGINTFQIKHIQLLMGWPLNFNKMINLLKPVEIQLVKKIIKFYFDLNQNKIFIDVEKKKKLKNYQGMRHLLCLPVRGQRTHTNSNTSRRNIKIEI